MLTNDEVQSWTVVSSNFPLRNTEKPFWTVASSQNMQWFLVSKCWDTISNSGLSSKILFHVKKRWNTILNSCPLSKTTSGFTLQNGETPHWSQIKKIQWFHANKYYKHCLKQWYRIQKFQWFPTRKSWKAISNSGPSLKVSGGFKPTNVHGHPKQWSLPKDIQCFPPRHPETPSETLVSHKKSIFFLVTAVERLSRTVVSCPKKMQGFPTNVEKPPLTAVSHLTAVSPSCHTIVIPSPSWH